MSTAVAIRPRVVAGHASKAIPPAVAAVAIVALWQGAIGAFGIDSFVLPAPSAILRALLDEWSVIISGARVTVIEVLLGMAMGTAAGLVAALVIARFRAISTPLLVVAVVVNCAPIVALAPIANNWLGVTSIFSKAAVAAVMVFFPVMVATARGLLEVGASKLELMQSVAATPRDVLLKVRLPHALPYLFSALRLGSTLSVIGAIVTEYLGGRSDALGVYIAQQASLPRYAEAWAGIVIACALGLALFAAVVIVERAVVPWHASRQAGR
jgi:NitT/TauT family transport system permease protein